MRERLPATKGEHSPRQTRASPSMQTLLVSGLLQESPESLSYITDRVERKTTPPLRGSRRGRAVLTKADSVGGKTRFIAIPNNTPHRIACGLAPLALRLPLKGGVNFKSVRATKIASRRLFQQPLLSRVWPTPPTQGEERGVAVCGGRRRRFFNNPDNG